MSSADLLLGGLELIALIYLALHYSEVRTISKRPENGEMKSLLSDMKALKSDLEMLDEKWTEKTDFLTQKTRRNASRSARERENDVQDEIDDGLNAVRAMNRGKK